MTRALRVVERPFDQAFLDAKSDSMCIHKVATALSLQICSRQGRMIMRFQMEMQSSEVCPQFTVRCNAPLFGSLYSSENIDQHLCQPLAIPFVPLIIDTKSSALIFSFFYNSTKETK